MSRSKFQSTLPVGEATSGTAQRQDKQFISIHASRGGSDQLISAAVPGRSRFQSTLPVGEATKYVFHRLERCEISIHASRGGSDDTDFVQCGFNRNFNPRFPWGKRLINQVAVAGASDFNPRFPWGKRPSPVVVEASADRFQSTLPVGEATPLILSFSILWKIFQSTLPVGEATA